MRGYVDTGRKCAITAAKHDGHDFRLLLYLLEAGQQLVHHREVNHVHRRIGQNYPRDRGLHGHHEWAVVRICHYFVQKPSLSYARTVANSSPLGGGVRLMSGDSRNFQPVSESTSSMATPGCSEARKASPSSPKRSTH